MDNHSTIQIPTKFKHWYGLDVVAMRGLGHSLNIFTLEAYKSMEDKITNTELAKGSPESFIRFITAGSEKSHIDPRGSLKLADHLVRVLGPHDIVVFTKGSDGLLVIKGKQCDEITILGEVFERKHFPKIARMLDTNKENTEAQLQSIANAWHGGSIVGAAQALESDLGN